MSYREQIMKECDPSNESQITAIEILIQDAKEDARIEAWKRIEAVLGGVHFAVYPDVIKRMKDACLS